MQSLQLLSRTYLALTFLTAVWDTKLAWLRPQAWWASIDLCNIISVTTFQLQVEHRPLRTSSPILFPLTRPHMHMLHDQAASHQVTWPCALSPQAPRQTSLTGRWEKTSAPWLHGRWHPILVPGKEDARAAELPTATTARFLSMPEMRRAEEVTEKGNRNYSGQLPIIQGLWCSHPLVHPLVP